jgi:hypothetical protein
MREYIGVLSGIATDGYLLDCDFEVDEEERFGRRLVRRTCPPCRGGGEETLRWTWPLC